MAGGRAQYNPGVSEFGHPVAVLSIVHLDDEFAVIDKPAGLHSVPGRGEAKQDSVETRAKIVFPDADGPIIVHRLDMETSGLMVIGLTKPAHRALQRQFMQRRVGKTYAALLDGRVESDEGAVDLPLIIDWPNRPRQMVDHERGRAARTLFRVKERDEARRITRVEFRPVTGRTHQLRVHAAMPVSDGGLGCPILGDTLYGDAARAARLMLHADGLAFWHPTGAGWRKFTSPAPF
jgi:tRNA pseudouridine32 synthase/23S rRNA pseudouridine746 synthase